MWAAVATALSFLPRSFQAGLADLGVPSVFLLHGVAVEADRCRRDSPVMVEPWVQILGWLAGGAALVCRPLWASTHSSVSHWRHLGAVRQSFHPRSCHRRDRTWGTVETQTPRFLPPGRSPKPQESWWVAGPRLGTILESLGPLGLIMWDFLRLSRLDCRQGAPGSLQGIPRAG